MRDEIVFTFPDTGNAMAGEKALHAAGIAVRVMPRPSSLGDGCGICLRVNPEDRPAAEEALGKEKIFADGVYLKTRENGTTGYRRLPVSAS